MLLSVESLELNVTIMCQLYRIYERRQHWFKVNWMFIYIFNGEAILHTILNPCADAGIGSCTIQDTVNATFKQVHEVKRLSVNKKLYCTWFTTLDIYHTSL